MVDTNVHFIVDIHNLGFSMFFFFFLQNITVKFDRKFKTEVKLSYPHQISNRILHQSRCQNWSISCCQHTNCTFVSNSTTIWCQKYDGFARWHLFESVSMWLYTDTYTGNDTSIETWSIQIQFHCQHSKCVAFFTKHCGQIWWRIQTNVKLS